MWRTNRLVASALIIGVALGVIGSQFAGAQQPTLKRTDLLKLDLGEIKDDSEMNVWVADIAAGAATNPKGAHFLLDLPMLPQSRS